jgi:hypothetical protein
MGKKRKTQVWYAAGRLGKQRKWYHIQNENDSLPTAMDTI